MNTKETIINVSRDFLASNSTSRLIRWVIVLFLLFNGIPQKTVASITNYTDRQVRNIRDQFENFNGGFPQEGKKRGFIIAIDETHEPFYGRLKNLWIHDYRNGVKGATGSYKYIVVSIVSGFNSGI